MNPRPTKTIWLGLLCCAVLGYLLLLGQVNIREFEKKLTAQSQSNLLRLAQGRQRHCSDLLELLAERLRSGAAHLSRSGPTLDTTGPVPGFEASVFERLVLSLERINSQDDRLQRFGDFGPVRSESSEQTAASYSPTSSAHESLSVAMDESSTPASLVMRYRPAEGAAFDEVWVLRICAEQLLAGLDDGDRHEATRSCLISAQGRLVSASQGEVLEPQPEWMTAQDASGRFLLDDVHHRRSGVGLFHAVGQDSKRPQPFLVGQWPLDRFESPWSIAVIQDRGSIEKAVAEHARNIQLGMVCLFLAVCLIWLLFYRSARRQIVYEQQTALGQATDELQHLSEQSRQTRQQLQRQVALYRGLLNAVPMGLYWKDSEGRLIGYNAEYAHIAGCKPMNHGAVPIRTELFEQQQEGLPLDMEVMNKDIELLFLPQTYSKDGLVRKFLVSKIAVKDESEQVCGLLGGLLNEDLLKTAQNHCFCMLLRSHCAAELLPMPALIVDRQGRMLHANTAFWTRFGMDPTSDVKQISDLLAIAPCDVFDRKMRAFAETPKGAEQGFFVHLDGDCFWATAQPIYDKDTLNGALLLLSDVGGVRQTEDYLETLLYRHRRVLSEISAQLNTLEKTTRSLSEQPDQDPAGRAEQLRIGIGACLETIAHCDALSTETTEADPTEPSMIGVEDLLQTVQQHIGQRYAALPMAISVSASCPARFEGQPQIVTQALTILAEHVAQAAGDEGVSIRVECAESSCRQKTMTVTFEHTGPSWLGDDAEKIIDPDCALRQWYARCDPPDQALHLRRLARLLAQSGSRLRMQRHSNHTGYSVELTTRSVSGTYTPPLPEPTISTKPVVKQETIEMQEQHTPFDGERNDAPARILIVDDVPENLALLKVILTKLGYDPVLCRGGREATALCEQEQFDLILMDIQMPELNGLEATGRIRAKGLNCAVPILAMTASNQMDDELAALEAGCDDYLTKPINRRQLEQKIWRNLAKKRQIQDAEKGLDITSFLEGDPDYHKTIETFVSNLPGRIEEMRQALQQQDFEALSFKVHALKGLGGFAGFSVYTEKAALLEESIRQQDVDKIQSRIDEMVQLCMRTKIKTDMK